MGRKPLVNIGEGYLDSECLAQIDRILGEDDDSRRFTADYDESRRSCGKSYGTKTTELMRIDSRWASREMNDQLPPPATKDRVAHSSLLLA
jgi:hypothetical protein